MSPHTACKEGLEVAGLDARTTERSGYRTSQRIRKRVEEIFGWMKTVGGMRRTRYRGVDRTQAWAYFVAGLQSASDNAPGLSCRLDESSNAAGPESVEETDWRTE